jgi:hypothetical protein
MTVGELVNDLTREAATLPDGMATKVVAWVRVKEAVGRLDVLEADTVQVGVRNNQPVAVITLDRHATKDTD